MQPFAILAAIAKNLIPRNIRADFFDVDDEMDVWGEVMMQVASDDIEEEVGGCSDPRL